MGVGVSSRVWLIVFAAVFAAALAAPVAALPADEEPAAEQAGASSLPLPDESAISAALEKAHQAELQEREQQEQELASPAAVQERELSERAYEDLPPAEAEALVTSIFGEVLEELNQDPVRYLSDAKVEQVAGDEAATVTSEGETQLLEANVPVRAEDEEGDLSKVDLSLVPAEGGWEPENPVVDVVVGGSAPEGIELSEAEVTISQAGAAASAGRPMGDKNLFYGEVGTDTDLLVAPVSTGVELFNVLRSEESPESLRFDLGLPAGATLRATEGGSAEVVDEEGKPSVVIPAPWARDAQGTPVPVAMTVEGNSLVLGVEHQEEDLAYPILVDPALYQNWGWWYQGQNLTGLGAFRWQQSAGAWWVHHGTSDTGFPGYEGKGLFIATAPGQLVGHQWGQYIYSAPNAGTYLANATINPFWRNNRQCAASQHYYPYDYTGMWTEAGGWNRLLVNNANDQGWSTLESWGESLIVGMSTDAPTNVYMPCWRDLMLGGVGVWLDDYQYPTVSVLSFPSGWLKKDGTNRVAELKGLDAGLGVQRVRMYAGAKEWIWDQPWCAGTYENRCGTERVGKINFTAESVGGEGKINLGIQAIDPTDKRWALERTVMIDGTAPTLNLTGESTPTAYKLNVEAKDGSSTEPRSGVKEVKIYLDGQLKDTRTTSCSTSGCPYTFSFTYSQSLNGLSEGKHTLEAVATDQVGYSKSATTTFNVEAPDTVIDSGPEGLTNDNTPTFTYHSTMAGSTFACSVDGGAYVSCPASGYTTAKLADGAHTFSVKATSGAGVTDPSPATRSFTVDATPPETTIDFGPQGLVAIDQPDYGYGSNDPEARFECRFDSAPFVECIEDEFFPETPLADGAHSFSVRAIDLAGNVDPTPATNSFTVDATPPIVEIKSGPEGPSKNPSPTFTFEAAGGTVSCTIEEESADPANATFGPCAGPSSHTAVPPLADGAYVFVVKVMDAAENEATDVRVFTVDATAPQTTIVSGPSGTTDDAKPSFAFDASENGVTFECRFDAAAFGPCSGPGKTHAAASALADGVHSFEVRATDAATNADPTPAKQVFTVKTDGPQTSIDSGPAGAISEPKAKFQFSASKPAVLECSLDGALFTPCGGSSKEYTGLAEGRHRFEVRALGDPTPARRDFIVDTSAPAAPTVSGPLTDPNQPGMTLQVKGEDGDPSSAASTRSGIESFRVKVDGKTVSTVLAPCENKVCPATATRTIQLPYQEAVGAHRIAVEGRDGVGHFSAPAEWDENAQASQELRARKGAPAPPNCPEGRYEIRKSGAKITGTDCSDLIIVIGAGKHTIESFAGNDVILAGPATDTIKAGPGNDLVRGKRSNDSIHGEDGNDLLYGGIGDDSVFGGPGNDLVDGGAGGDGMVGEAGDDTVRGGQGENFYTGNEGEDTFSFSDAVTPGFRGNVQSNFKGFPGPEPGIRINLTTNTATNGPIKEGGQDNVFNDPPERVVGSAFSDHIIGTAGAEKIDGGPGADLIEDGGGNDEVVNDPADYRQGDETAQRDFPERKANKVVVGVYDSGIDASPYLAGSSAADEVTIRRSANSVQFIAKPDTASRYETKSPCNRNGQTVNCPLGDAPLGAVVAYGDRGSDNLELTNEQATMPGAFTLLGGNARDDLKGGEIEDLLVDGRRQASGTEHLRGGAGDDALLQGSRADMLEGGPGNDLLISGTICRPGEDIYGDSKEGENVGSDNAQFHFIAHSGVNADLAAGQVGEVGMPGGKCGNGKYGELSNIDILEGSPKADVFHGDDKTNLLLGRGGRDTMFGKGGTDALHGMDEAQDRRIDCGGQPKDVAHIDEKLGDLKVTKRCKNTDEDAHPYPDRPKAGTGTKATISSFDDSPLSAEEGTPRLSNYYGLDESSGTGAQNGAGANNGTYKAAGSGPSGPNLGAGSALVGAGRGTAVAFDGVDDYVDLGNRGAPRGGDAGAYSTAMFAKFGRAPGAREFLFAAGDASDGAFLYREADGRLTFATGLVPGAPEVTSAVPVNDGSWHHLVGTLEGETITLFVDGFAYRLGYGSSVMPQPGQQAQGQIGTGPGLSGFFAGTIDEVMVYDSALGEGSVGAQIAESKAEEPEVLLAPAPEGDGDGDGVVDGDDNCPAAANPDQADTDMNGAGDACEAPDSDADGVLDASDNCPSVYNPDQADANSDGTGDLCASMPPTAQTEPATSVKATTATFNAKIDPENLPTTYRFEYGTTTAYGAWAPLFPAKSAGSGTVASLFDHAVTGLAPNTTYHYRVVATNSAGQTYGDDQTLTTPKLPAATTEPATGIGTTSATLNATVNPEGSATTYQFAYGPTTAYGGKVPAAPKSIGSGTTAVSVSETLKALQPNTTYHYRVEAVSETGTTVGKDGVFKTAALPVSGAQLDAMKVSEPFDATAASNANFAANFSALGWGVGKGAVSSFFGTGWQPVNAFPAVYGAAYSPVLTDTGAGVAAAVTMTTNPNNPERYFSLWLDVPNPAATTRSGYELRFVWTAANTYTVTLAKWQAGAQTVLASKAGFGFANGNSLAIVDQGSTVSAWTNTGAGFTQLLSAQDSAFSSGNAGVEGSGNITRLSNFKAGIPLAPVAGMDAALSGLETRDSFDRNESPLSANGAWGALAWDTATGTKTGRVDTTGWGPWEAFSNVNGAFWQSSTFADTGSGDAVAATMARNPSNPERYFSLWLNMPNPAAAKSGYELRFTETTSLTFDVSLSKWEAGTKTVLATKTAHALPLGAEVALVRRGGAVQAWVDTGSGFTQLLSVPDPTFIHGFAGVEGSGNITRLSNFRAGPLAPF